MSPFGRAVVLVSLLGACNAVYDLDDTVLFRDNPRIIELDNSASRTDLVDLIVPITLDSTRIEYDEVGDPTTELRFFDPVSQQDLPFEIEVWDPTGESTLWVRGPLVPAGATDTRIEMYYGADTNGTEDPAGLWADHQLVVHGGPDGFDSSIGAYTTMRTGAVADTGVFSGSVRFTGRNQGIEYVGSGAALDGAGTFTMELWIYPEVDPFGGAVNANAIIVEKGGSMRLSRLEQRMDIGPDYRYYQTDFQFADTCATDSTAEDVAYLHTMLPLGVWSHVVYTYDGQALWLYRNGTLEAVFECDTGAPLIAASNDFSLGNGLSTMIGMLDEVRVSTRYRSGDYVRAQYLMMLGRFVRFAASERPR